MTLYGDLEAMATFIGYFNNTHLQPYSVRVVVEKDTVSQQMLGLFGTVKIPWTRKVFPVEKVVGLEIAENGRFKHYFLQCASPEYPIPVSPRFNDANPLPKYMSETLMPQLQKRFGDSREYWMREAQKYVSCSPGQGEGLRRHGAVYVCERWPAIAVPVLITVIFGLGLPIGLMADFGADILWKKNFFMLKKLVPWFLLSGIPLICGLAFYQRLYFDARRRVVGFGRGVFMFRRRELPVENVLRVEKGNASGNFNLFCSVSVYYLDGNVERQIPIGVYSPRKAERIERDIMGIVAQAASIAENQPQSPRA